MEPCRVICIGVLAERVGFEPTLEFPLNTLSKRAPSTTRPSLQTGTQLLEVIILGASFRGGAAGGGARAGCCGAQMKPFTWPRLLMYSSALLTLPEFDLRLR